MAGASATFRDVELGDLTIDGTMTLNGGALKGTGAGLTYTADPAPAAVTSATGTAAASPLTATGGVGGAASAATSTGGVGGGFVLTSGAGGAATGATAATGGAGGAITMLAGAGAAISAAGTDVGGAGGAVSMTAGVGGAATVGSSTTGGAGGAASLVAGAGGAGTTAGGVGGNVSITAGASGAGGNINGGVVSLTAGAATGTGNVGQIQFASAFVSSMPTGLPTTGTLGSNVTSVTPATGSNDQRGRLVVVGSGAAVAAFTNVATVTFNNAKRWTAAGSTLAAPAVFLTNSTLGNNTTTTYLGFWGTSIAPTQTAFIITNNAAGPATAWTVSVDYFVFG